MKKIDELKLHLLDFSVLYLSLVVWGLAIYGLLKIAEKAIG